MFIVLLLLLLNNTHGSKEFIKSSGSHTLEQKYSLSNCADEALLYIISVCDMCNTH